MHHRIWTWAAAGMAVIVTACTGQPPLDPGSQRDAGDHIAEAIEVQFASGEPFDQVRAVVVLRDGERVLESYYDTDDSAWWDVESITKSVISMLVGIAIEEGAISGVEQTLGELLPALADQMTPRAASITLHELLTMTAGLEEVESAMKPSAFERSKDPVRHVLRHPGPHRGSFAYSNAGTHLLSEVLRVATGEPVLDYARSRLFDPLGIPSRPALQPEARPREVAAYLAADFAWPVDPQGRHLGYRLLKLRPTDLARLGQLYLDGGRWEGEQVVPEAWVRDSTSAQVSLPIARDGFDSYGYLWWLGTVGGHAAFASFGFGGQLILVLPDLETVVAVAVEIDPFSITDYGVSAGNLVYLIESAVLPALAPE